MARIAQARIGGDDGDPAAAEGRGARVAGWRLDATDDALHLSADARWVLGIDAGTHATLETLTAACAPDSRSRLRQVVQTCLSVGISFDEEILRTAADCPHWVRLLGARVDGRQDGDVSVVARW